jgi:hypothetical protein
MKKKRPNQNLVDRSWTQRCHYKTKCDCYLMMKDLVAKMETQQTMAFRTKNRADTPGSITQHLKYSSTSSELKS